MKLNHQEKNINKSLYEDKTEIIDDFNKLNRLNIQINDSKYKSLLKTYRANRNTYSVIDDPQNKNSNFNKSQFSKIKFNPGKKFSSNSIQLQSRPSRITFHDVKHITNQSIKDSIFNSIDMKFSYINYNYNCNEPSNEKINRNLEETFHNSNLLKEKNCIEQYHCICETLSDKTQKIKIEIRPAPAYNPLNNADEKPKNMKKIIFTKINKL